MSPDPASLVLGYLAELRGIPPEDWTDGPVTDRALRLARLDALSILVSFLAAELETDLIDSMETDTVDIPGGGRLVRSETSSSTWNGEHASEQMRHDLALAVATALAVDVATGAIDTGRRNIALAAVNAAYEAIPSFSSLKVAGRKRFGLEIGDYRTYSTSYKVHVEQEEDER